MSLGVGSEMLSNVDSADSVEYVTTAAGAALGGTMVAVISGFFGFFFWYYFVNYRLSFVLGRQKRSCDCRW